MTQQVRFPIDGMTCTSCVAHISRAVGKVDGVESVKVDLASDSAVVAYDSARASLTEIGWAVRQAGYEPHVEAAESWVAPPRRGLLARLTQR